MEIDLQYDPLAIVEETPDNSNEDQNIDDDEYSTRAVWVHEDLAQVSQSQL